MFLRPVLAGIALCLLLFAPALGADHPQEGGPVVFDHRGGNEWWVEVDIDGSVTWDSVRARDEGGAWVALERRSWGVWAASFHIEPGNRVQFEAGRQAGQTVQSCWFTHPQGVEECAEAPPPAVSFDHTGGNEWWVQTRVTGQPSRVQAMDIGGTWRGLQFQDWGDWAASFHIEPGNEVRFRAWVGDAWQTSCWFTHPGGRTPTGGTTCVAGDNTPPPPSGEFDAKFDPKPGNEWWVEVGVTANEPLAGVAARDDGGAWIALEKTSWGAWAKSFHVADGSIVEFRAASSDGDTDMSRGYRWPDATPVGDEPPPPPPGGADVAFGPKAGNEWWVETYAVMDGTVTGVDARVGTGPWHRLTLRAWGTWAGSFHVPDGSTVTFRATTSDGSDTSDAFRWPGATVVGGDGTWPEEGSYTYNRMIDDPPGGYHANGWSTDVYHDGIWWRMHEWEEGYLDDTVHKEAFSTFACKSYGPTSGVQVGDDVHITRPCDGQSRNATVRYMEDVEMRIEGDKRTIDVWHASDRDPCGCLEWRVDWDDDLGLVTYQVLAGRAASGHELRDTDAPLT